MPRAVVAGRCYMVTRRCCQRRFLMRPDGDTTNAFLYCLAVAAKRTQVEVIFFVAMSNHYHAGVIDTAGRLPEFLEYFHKLFAKHQNVLRGRWENFWASEQTSAVELVDQHDILDKMVYALTNPVKDHLVEFANQWPGATSFFAHLDGHVVQAFRPRRFFRPDGHMPAEVQLVLSPLPGLAGEPSADVTAELRERIASVEHAAAEQRAQRGIKVLGAKAILRQRWSDRPGSREPRRRLSPRVACKNLWRRIETLRRNKRWVAAHRDARERLRVGLEAVFPPGTYWLRRFAGVRCQDCELAAAP
jgi:putative transposase